MTENQPKPISTNKTTVFIDEDKNTQLHYVAAYGDLDKVKKEFEENDHEVDPVNYLGWTPLMMATRYGHMAVIEYLLEKRADSTRKNKFGFNILLVAVASGKLEVLHFILQHLLRGGVSRQIMQNFFSPISLAVLFNNVSMLQYLIEKRFCIHAECVVGIKPITFAKALGNPDIINILMSNGANNNQNPPPPPPPPPKENVLINTNNNNNYNNHNNNNNPQPKHVPPPPLVLLNHNHFNPHPAFVQYTPAMQMPRKCSGMMSPCFSANLSPLPGGYVQQVFFPPSFSPSHFVSPTVNPHLPIYPNNEFLNVRFMQVSPHCSPMPVNIPYNIPYKT